MGAHAAPRAALAALLALLAQGALSGAASAHHLEQLVPSAVDAANSTFGFAHRTTQPLLALAWSHACASGCALPPVHDAAQGAAAEAEAAFTGTLQDAPSCLARTLGAAGGSLAAPCEAARRALP